MPENEDQLYYWIAGLMVGYLMISGCLRARRENPRKSDSSWILPSIFDAATFAVSVMLLIGVIEPRVLAAIGSTKPFLLIASLAGISYGWHQLWKLRN